MRDHIREIINQARRSGDRIDVENKQELKPLLGAGVIRLARLATSVHMTESARLLAASDPVREQSSSMRELTT